MSVVGWSDEVTGWYGATPRPTSCTVTVVNCRKPVPWTMYTVSPSPKGWLTHSSGVVPTWWKVHGGGFATGPGSVTRAVLLAVLVLTARALWLPLAVPAIAAALGDRLLLEVPAGVSPTARAPGPCSAAPIPMPPPS